MEENTNNVNENSSEKAKRKKIVIIIAAIAVIAIIAAAVLFALTRKSDNGYVDTPIVTEIVTDAQGEPVTDDQGEVVTRVVTTAKNNSANSGSGNNKQSGNSAGNQNSGSGSSSQGSGSGNDNQGNSAGDNQGSGSGNNNQSEGNVNPPIDPPQPDVSKPRKIKITVVLPAGKEDTLEISINGKRVISESVKLDLNSERYFETEEYTGDVTVEVKLVSYGSQYKTTVPAGSDSVKISMPLNQVEEQEGIDD